MRIAVTGGIGEGKSTVLGYLRDLGFRVSSADEIARRIFDDPQVNERLAALAGVPSPIAPTQLREAIAADPTLRRRVNSTMHPRIIALMEAEETDFMEVPLLIEACLQGVFDRTWVVTCGREEQLRRLVERYGDQAKAEAIIATQLCTSAKTPFSDLVVRTNEEPETVRRLVSEALTAL